jgi:hypothetical protein
MQAWTEEQVRAVMTDPASPMNKRAAARSLLDACSDAKNSAGMPVAGADLDRIIEHTAGKATQPVDVTSAGESLVQLIDRATWEKV